jgi:hypothetical protein
MNLFKFIKNSGFKVLALARLNQCEYSMVFYLLNCNASGMDQIITNENELSSLLGYELDAIRQALISLSERKIVSVSYQEKSTSMPSSLCLGVQFDFERWILNFRLDLTPRDALIYPFQRSQSAIPLFKKEEPQEKSEKEPWEKIFATYMIGRSLNDDELTIEEEFAQTLCDTHSYEQILVLIDHFGLRIKNLSLLASSWQHYIDLFETETQKVDLMEARKKHQELDEQVKKSAQEWLNQNTSLSEDENYILNLMIAHQHPRRQLFWAFQSRDRYKNLSQFFEENTSRMLGITSSGIIIKKPHTY